MAFASAPRRHSRQPVLNRGATARGHENNGHRDKHGTPHARLVGRSANLNQQKMRGFNLAGRWICIAEHSEQMFEKVNSAVGNVAPQNTEPMDGLNP